MNFSEFEFVFNKSSNYSKDNSLEKIDRAIFKDTTNFAYRYLLGCRIIYKLCSKY